MTDYVEAWRRTVLGEHKSWVLFEHGTCVVLVDPVADADLAAAAVEILREFGPVHIASPAADFGVITLDPGPGYVVTGHHNDVLTFVGEDEVAEPSDVAIGLHGRQKRDRDGHELRVVHVEDRRQRRPLTT